MTNGVELPVLYLVGSQAVAFAGPGQYSFDYALRLDSVFTQAATLIALGLGLLAALINVAVRVKTKSAIDSSRIPAQR